MPARRTGPTKAAPKMIHTRNEENSPTVSVNSVARSSCPRVAAPKTIPAMKAATKPLPE